MLEDSLDDEALMLRKNNVDIDVIVAQDGADAIDYLFGIGTDAGRDAKEAAGSIDAIEAR